MRCLIMNQPLLISSLISHADWVSGDREIITRSVEGPIHRYNYRDAHARSRRLANALKKLGVKLGDRIATLAWNTYRHFECYYAISGIGAITHTLNPRLAADQLTYIINHAENAYIFVDADLLPLIELVAHQIPSIKGIVVMTDRLNIPAVSYTHLTLPTKA